MNKAAHKAILRTFRRAGINAGYSLTKLQLIEGFLEYYPNADALEAGIEELIVEVQFLEAEDEANGPYTLTEDGYRASLNFVGG